MPKRGHLEQMTQEVWIFCLFGMSPERERSLAPDVVLSPEFDALQRLCMCDPTNTILILRGHREKPDPGSC